MLGAFGVVGNIMHDEILLNIRRKANIKGKSKAEAGEHYSLPQGGLYTLVSYPNYLCECSIFSSLLNPKFYTSIINEPGYLFAPSLSPPWIFLLYEFFLWYLGHIADINGINPILSKAKKSSPFVL
jgi:3-oxo-5-alpha-steroid 4-dehydrogenase 1